MAEKKPFMIVALGDFNVKSKSWYINDSTNFEGSKTEFLTISSNHKEINPYLEQFIHPLNI